MSRSNILIFGGLAASLVAAIGWIAALVSLDNVHPQQMTDLALQCLVTFAAGKCGILWWAGYHQTNLLASAVFYGGLIAVIIGVFRATPTQSAVTTKRTNGGGAHNPSKENTE